MAQAARVLFEEAKRTLDFVDPERCRQVMRAARLAAVWAVAYENGVLAPHLHAGFGRPGDDLVRAHKYLEAGKTLLAGTALTSPATAHAIIEEVISRIRLDKGEHASLFTEEPPKTVADDVNLLVYQSSIDAANALLVPGNPQPLLRRPHPVTKLIVLVALNTLTEEQRQHIIRGEPIAPSTVGRDRGDLAEIKSPFTYFSAGSQQATTVQQLDDTLATICTPSTNMRPKIKFIRQQLSLMSPDAPVPVSGPISGYAGLCDALNKLAVARLDEHEDSKAMSGANSRWAFHEAVGPCSHFGAIFRRNVFTCIYQLLPKVSPKLINATLEALTQATTKAILNDDLMGGSEIGGAAKRINKAINRYASQLIALAGGTEV